MPIRRQPILNLLRCFFVSAVQAKMKKKKATYKGTNNSIYTNEKNQSQYQLKNIINKSKNSIDASKYTRAVIIHIPYFIGKQQQQVTSLESSSYSWQPQQLKQLQQQHVTSKDLSVLVDFLFDLLLSDLFEEAPPSNRGDSSSAKS